MNERKSIAIESNQKKSNAKKSINQIRKQTNKQLSHWILFEWMKEKNENYSNFNQWRLEKAIKENKQKSKTNSILKFERIKENSLQDFNWIWVFAKKSIIYSNAINQKWLNENQLKALESLYNLLHIIQNWNWNQFIDFYWFIQTWIINDINDKNSVWKLWIKMQLKEKVAFENAINAIINQIIDWKFKQKSINMNKLRQSILKYIENKKDYQTIDNELENWLQASNDFENYINSKIILEKINQSNDWKIEKIFAINRDIDNLKKDYKLKKDWIQYKDYQKKLNSLLQKIRVLKKSINVDCYK